MKKIIYKIIVALIAIVVSATLVSTSGWYYEEYARMSSELMPQILSMTFMLISVVIMFGCIGFAISYVMDEF